MQRATVLPHWGYHKGKPAKRHTAKPRTEYNRL